MAEIRAFRAYRYNTGKIRDISKVVSLPYDVISENLKKEYCKASPYNYVKIILPEGAGAKKYANAGSLLNKWIKKGILIKEAKPSFYILKQKFKIRGKSRERYGLLCLVKLVDYSKKQVIPHEQTFKKHKQDRLKLLRACKANLSQIFGFFDGLLELKPLCKRPVIKFKMKDKMGDVYTEVFLINDEKKIKKIGDFLSKKKIFIADGHHRYDVGLNYKKEMERKHGKVQGALWNYIMFVIFSLQDKGLEIMPTHRIVRFKTAVDHAIIESALKKEFVLKEGKYSYTNKHIMLYTGRKTYNITPRNGNIIKNIKGGNSLTWKKLPTAILHFLILKRLPEAVEISYTRDTGDVIKEVNAGKNIAGFFIPNIKIKDVTKIAVKTEKMPQKTTYFYPKIPAGIALSKFE